MLVRLALDAGQLVSAERLIDDLWGDAATTTGRNTLQSKVSQLRRALGDPALVASGHGGYTLELDPACVDALLVTGLAADASAARRAADASTALEAATEALGLFRGEVLADAGDGDWLRPHRARLEELRLGLLEDQAAARVGLGAGAELLAELEWLVGPAPPARGAVGLLHHRPLPGRASGRRPGRRPAGAAAAGHRARHRAREGPARARAGDPAPGGHARPRHPRARDGDTGPGRRQPAQVVDPAGRAGRRPRHHRPAARRRPAGHPGRAGGRRQDPDRPRGRPRPAPGRRGLADPAGGGRPHHLAGAAGGRGHTASRGGAGAGRPPGRGRDGAGAGQLRARPRQRRRAGHPAAGPGAAAAGPGHQPGPPWPGRRGHLHAGAAAAGRLGGAVRRPRGQDPPAVHPRRRHHPDRRGGLPVP